MTDVVIDEMLYLRLLRNTLKEVDEDTIDLLNKINSDCGVIESHLLTDLAY